MLAFCSSLFSLFLNARILLTDRGPCKKPKCFYCIHIMKRPPFTKFVYRNSFAKIANYRQLAINKIETIAPHLKCKITPLPTERRSTGTLHL